MPTRKPTTMDQIRALGNHFVIERQGKDAALYAGLLALAHDTLGIQEQRVTMLQFPSEANGWTAISHAHFRFDDGTISEEIGDANAQNVGRMISVHIIRMSATRAKARALRDRLNVGGAALEEFGEADDRADEVSNTRQRARPTAPKEAPQVAPKPETAAATWAAKNNNLEQPAAQVATPKEQLLSAAWTKSPGDPLNPSPPLTGAQLEELANVPAHPNQLSKIMKLHGALLKYNPNIKVPSLGSLTGRGATDLIEQLTSLGKKLKEEAEKKAENTPL